MRKNFIPFSTRAGTSERLAASTFVLTTHFFDRGAVMTDLDGTALDEQHGSVFVPPPVRSNMARLAAAGIPILLNTLRFPRSVIDAVGREWYDIGNIPVPGVYLNGSVSGFLMRSLSGDLKFKEETSKPLAEDEIDRVADRVGSIIESDGHNAAVFFYPRDWRSGEILWTTNHESVSNLAKRYVSASVIISTSVEDLRVRMKELQACMAFVLRDARRDGLMAYQHTESSDYFTAFGVNKASGARRLASRLGVSLADSIGAGDAQLDNFLAESGLAVHVRRKLPFFGLHGTIRIDNQFEFGDLLSAVADAVARRW